MTFGEKIKTIRENRRLSQSALAEKMHVTQQAVAKYEKIVEQPKLATVRKLANALDVPISELIDNWESIPEEEIIEDLKGHSPSKRGLAILGDASDDILKHAHEIAAIGKDLIKAVNKLNTEGQQKVKEYADDLAENPKYRKDTE